MAQAPRRDEPLLVQVSISAYVDVESLRIGLLRELRRAVHLAHPAADAAHAPLHDGPLLAAALRRAPHVHVVIDDIGAAPTSYLLPKEVAAEARRVLLLALAVDVDGGSDASRRRKRARPPGDRGTGLEYPAVTVWLLGQVVPGVARTVRIPAPTRV